MPFDFLRAEWPDVHEAAAKAAAAVYPDPRTACFYARRALELAVSWAYKSDASLRLPYQDNLSALIHDPTFKAVAGEAVFNKARVINSLGNQAVHSHRPIQQVDALTSVRELFHVSFWLARTYARGAKPDPTLAFDAETFAEKRAASEAGDRLSPEAQDRAPRARREVVGGAVRPAPHHLLHQRLRPHAVRLQAVGVARRPRAQLDALLAVLEQVRASAVAA
jgi:Domain of unknown function (DUF4145)